MKTSTEYSREWRVKNKERNLEINRKAQKKWYDKMIQNPSQKMLEKWSRRYYNLLERIPEKIKARELLRYNIRTGKIKRGICEICKSPKAEGHHPDYFKPLEVRWLCSKHHRDLHNK